MGKKLLCLFLALFLLVGAGVGTWATTSGTVKKEQTETKNKLNQINQDISAIENKKDQMRAELNNLNEELVEALLTLEVLEADLEKKQER